MLLGQLRKPLFVKMLQSKRRKVLKKEKIKPKKGGKDLGSFLNEVKLSLIKP